MEVGGGRDLAPSRRKEEEVCSNLREIKGAERESERHARREHGGGNELEMN
jgi:hypothetical protein